jgi:cell shape-determining protein MreC
MGLGYLKKENEQLKQIVNLASRENIKGYKPVRLNTLNSNVYSNRVGIQHGLADGLHEGDPVIDMEGNLIGKIIRLQENNSEIMLITDPNSKISARTEKSKINMILLGNRTKFLGIGYIDGEEYNFKDNEGVFISSHVGGNNFNVGVLVKTKQSPRVMVNSNFNKISYAVVVLQGK